MKDLTYLIIIVLGLIYILGLYKCQNDTENNYTQQIDKYQQQIIEYKSNIQNYEQNIQNLNNDNDELKQNLVQLTDKSIYFDSIASKRKSDIDILKKDLNTKMDSLYVYRIDSNYVYDFKDSIIDKQDTIIKQKHLLLNDKDSIISNRDGIINILESKQLNFKDIIDEQYNIIETKDYIIETKDSIIDIKDKQITKYKRQRWLFGGTGIILGYILGKNI